MYDKNAHLINSMLLGIGTEHSDSPTIIKSGEIQPDGFDF